MKRAAKVIAAALKETDHCPLLLEQTAGHKGLLGRDFDQTAELIELAGGGERLGLCLDSCHLFVQGYDITDDDPPRRGPRRSRREGRPRPPPLLHVNDAAAPLGSCRDRHANSARARWANAASPPSSPSPASRASRPPSRRRARKEGPSEAEVSAAKRLRRE